MKGGYYVRLSVYDHPGAAAAIATRFAEQKISLESILQKGRARIASHVALTQRLPKTRSRWF